MRALPYVGVVLLWAVTVTGVLLAVQEAVDLDDAILEGTRTPIPGQRTLTLDERRYNVFFEASDIVDPDRVGDRLDDPDTSPLKIRVREEGSDRLLDLNGYSGSFTVGDSTAIASVRIPREGRYHVSVASSAGLPYSNPRIVFGEPIGRRVVRLVGWTVVAAVALLSGLLILIVTLVMRSRRTT